MKMMNPLSKATRISKGRAALALALATLALTGASLLPSAHAAKFANQFVEFELPAQWQCNLEGAEWVCNSADPAKRRDAMIVLAAKVRGPQDSLDQYLEFLKAPKSYNSPQNRPVTSEPRYAKTVSLNGQAWVDALHLSSEISGFYTRYLATIKSDIGVLVTYSINKDKYQLYVNDFEGMVKTLKVFRKAGGLNAAPANANLFNLQAPAGVSPDSVFNPQGGADNRPLKKEPDDTLYYLILGGAAVAFILWRRRKNGSDRGY
jgi:hypothetical protein